jgi:hypothetical protein
MRNLITTVALLALLGGPVAIAQTTGSARSSAGPASPTVPSSLTPDTRLIGSAPVGHRQPHASDVPSDNSNDLEHISAEDAAVDRKINNILPRLLRLPPRVRASRVGIIEMTPRFPIKLVEARCVVKHEWNLAANLFLEINTKILIRNKLVLRR